MIIVKLIGGLGNQMFQYAAGRQLALKHKTILKLDISAYDNVDPAYRHYSLGDFNISENIAAKNDLPVIKKTGIAKLFEKLKPYYKRNIIKYRDYNFDQHILELSDNVYLDGYWQSEKYFKNIETVLRHELTLKNEFGKTAKIFSEKMSATESLSLHIRRGDYLLQKFSSIYPVQPIKYYHEALNKLKEKVKDPTIFIFTDDVAWVKDNLDIPCPVEYVSGNNDIKDYEEIILMSKCRHNIIANSSFSWWSAWLNTNPDKIVIAPRRWLSVDDYRIDDLVPGTWTKI